jgi:hypothetical protein
MVGVYLTLQPTQAQDVSTYTLAPPTMGSTFTPLTGGTAVAAIQDDDILSGSIPLGFSFVFDGAPQTQVRASSNGFLTFNQSANNSGVGNGLATGAANLRPLIAPLWDDLDGTLGTASYATTGTAPNRVFTFQWLNWLWNFTAAAPVISFQVKLYETTNRVEFVYRQEAGPVANGSASIGLSGTGTGPGSFLSLSDVTATPASSSTTETTTIATKPATGQLYRFLPGPVPTCSAPRNLAVGLITATTAPVSWTSTSTGNTYTVEYGPTGFMPGSAVGTRVPNITGTSYTITGLVPTTAYQFYVTQNCGATNGNSAQSGPVAFTTLALPPANDDCANAVLLTSGATCTTTSGTVQAATQSLGAGTCGTGTPPTTAADVWYRFTATNTSQIIQATASFTPVVEVRSGTCATSVSVACGTGSRLVVSGLAVGTVYYLRLYSSSNTVPSTPTFTICVTNAPTGPANDNCTTAQALPTLVAGGGCTSVTGTNVGATDTPNVPAPGCASYNGGDIWYSLVVPASGVITVQTDSIAGSAVSDTGLALYSGACSNLTLITCDDDGSSNGLFSKITLTGRLAGETIYVRAWEYGNDTFGRFKVCASFDVAPANDEPAGAVTLNFAADCISPVSGSNTVASTTVVNGYTNPGNCGNNTAPKDVWYKFTTLASGRGSVEATITVAGLGAGSVRLFTMAAGALTPVMGGCSASTNATSAAPAFTSTTLTPGTTYYVQISNYSNADGGAPFTICLTAPSNCPIPVGLSASAITSASATLNWTVGATMPSGTFTLEYGPQNFVLGTGTRITGITGLNRTLTGLTPTTDYCFYVRQECDPASGTSAFSTRACFRTTLAPSPNDEPCAAIPLTLGATPTMANNIGATTSTPNGYANPGCSTASAPKDVWFSYTAPSGSHELVVTGNPAGQVRVFSAASCNGPFTQLACQASIGPNTTAAALSMPAPASTTSGPYYVSVSGFGSNDFQGTFSIQVRSTILSTGQGTLLNGEVQVYPNPSHDGVLNLAVRGAGLEKQGQAVLFNSLGQQVLVQAVPLRGGAATQVLAVPHLAKGFYTLRLRVGQHTITRKVVLD